MPLGTWYGGNLGPGHIVLGGGPAPPRKGAGRPTAASSEESVLMCIYCSAGKGMMFKPVELLSVDYRFLKKEDKYIKATFHYAIQVCDLDSVMECGINLAETVAMSSSRPVCTRHGDVFAAAVTDNIVGLTFGQAARLRVVD